MTKPDPTAEAAKRAQEAEEREVDRLLKKAETLAIKAEKPEAGAQALIGIARLRSMNAGLDKRHAQKVDATVTPGQTPDEWMASLGKGKPE